MSIQSKSHPSLTRWPWLSGAGAVLLAAGLMLNWASCTPQEPTEIARRAQAASRPSTNPATQDAPDLLLGRWEGTWTSHGGRGSDKLVCTVRPGENGAYEANFRANFFRIFRMDNLVILEVERTPQEWSFSGKKDLGALAGGVYTYEGTTDGEALHSTYKCKADHGVYEMKRVSTDPDADD